eukprot:scaffold5057_cov274-Prasinococcus_capsulatus_cf.AAC.2
MRSDPGFARHLRLRPGAGRTPPVASRANRGTGRCSPSTRVDTLPRHPTTRPTSAGPPLQMEAPDYQGAAQSCESAILAHSPIARSTLSTAATLVCLCLWPGAAFTYGTLRVRPCASVALKGPSSEESRGSRDTWTEM